jgi:hypothetical protein
MLCAFMPPSAFARRSADAPDGAMGVCMDNTYTYSREKRGACRENGGVKRWYRESAEAVPAAASATPRPPTGSGSPASQAIASGSVSRSRPGQSKFAQRYEVCR